MRYRYYVSQPGLYGEARTARLGAVSRVPAPKIEQAIVQAVQAQIGKHESRTNQNKPIQFDHPTLTSLVSRIEVQKNRLIVSLKPTDQSTEPEVLSVPWQKPPSKRFRKILLPHGAIRENTRPERAERRARLVNAIARGRRWLNEIVVGSVSDTEHLAKRERCTLRQVNLTISLAFLAPQFVKATVERRLPHGINIERLRDPTPNWTKQFQDLGLDPG